MDQLKSHNENKASYEASLEPLKDKFKLLEEYLVVLKVNI